MNADKQTWSKWSCCWRAAGDEEKLLLKSCMRWSEVAVEELQAPYHCHSRPVVGTCVYSLSTTVKSSLTQGPSVLKFVDQQPCALLWAVGCNQRRGPVTSDLMWPVWLPWNVWQSLMMLQSVPRSTITSLLLPTMGFQCLGCCWHQLLMLGSLTPSEARNPATCRIKDTYKTVTHIKMH